MSKKEYVDVPYPYNHERDLEVAQHLEEYVDRIDSLFILDGVSEEKIKKAVKYVKKNCKYLREGHPEKVYDETRYLEYIQSDPNKNLFSV